MAISESLVPELRNKVDLRPKVLRAALQKTKGNVDKAVLALMDAGEVVGHQLNALEFPDAAFVRARKGWIRAQLNRMKALIRATEP